MHFLDIAALVISIAAVFSFVNDRYLRLPTVIGLMAMALVMSLALVAAGMLGYTRIEESATAVIEAVDFDETLMHGMLSFLLFAGALHVDLNDLKQQRVVIATLATFGTVASTFLVGTLFWLLVDALDLELAYVHCLLFGALISPTDPIAVLGILKSAGAAKSLETKITGESLFNDGVGVVLFVVIAGIAAGDAEVSASRVLSLLAFEAIGGIAYGLVLGGLAYWMLSRVDNYAVEVLITLALVMGGYSFSFVIHTSGPIAMVVAGLLIGNHGRAFAMSARTREHLDTFWELMDEILNTALFVLIGFELLVIAYSERVLLAALLSIPLVLLVRLVCVGVPVRVLSPWRAFSPGAVRVLTWGGLRGGISVALALSMPAGPERDLIVPVTYVVVVFSILVQGLTVGRLVRAVSARASPGAAPP